MKPDAPLDDPNFSKAEALWQLELAQRKIRVAKIMLIVLGSLYIAYYLITYLINPTGDFRVIYEAVAVGGFFIISGLLTKRYPAGTLSLAFLVYLVYQIIVAIFYGTAGIMSGVIWKIIIFSALLVGIRGAVQYRKVQDQLDNHTNP